MKKQYIPGSPEHVVVGEMTGQEYGLPSGKFDTDSGRELTKWELIELQETELGAQGVFLNSNGYLSKAAREHNTKLADSRQTTVESMIFAAVSKRKPRA